MDDKPIKNLDLLGLDNESITASYIKHIHATQMEGS